MSTEKSCTILRRSWCSIFPQLSSPQSSFIYVEKKDEKQHRTTLLNLKISTLQDYKWYKYTFMSCIYKINDSQSHVWKDKVIAGLPKGFVEILWSKLGNVNMATIPLKRFFSWINSEIIDSCTRERQRQTKKKDFRDEEGDICEQFNLCKESKSDLSKKKKKAIIS